MFCEICKKAEATIHLTEIIKDVKSEIHLCENCAREIGLNSKLSNFSISVPEMLTFLDVNDVEEKGDDTICRTCGLSFVDYSRNGKLGCQDCYRYLRDSLLSVIVSYHGEKRHVGKLPGNICGSGSAVSAPVSGERAGYTVAELRERLEKAVEEERYEDAAILRDRIRTLSGMS